MRAKKLTELAMLTGVALIIFIVELKIPNPFPIPGVKLGLANIITVYAIYKYTAKEVLMIVATRIVLAAMFSGNLIALAYSFSGGLLCLVGMLILKKVVPMKHIWFSSVCGAMLHNIGQISVAILITNTVAIIAYLPVLLISGCCAGLFTGLCAQLIIKRNIAIVNE